MMMLVNEPNPGVADEEFCGYRFSQNQNLNHQMRSTKKIGGGGRGNSPSNEHDSTENIILRIEKNSTYKNINH